MMNACSCNSGQPFVDCCGPLLDGKKNADTPEALMRSRYSAFCSGNVEYLLQTHLADAHSADGTSQIQATIANTEWLNLDVIETGISGDKGVVEFIAYYRDRRGVGQLHERSDFLRQDNRWFYTGGIHLPALKPQRNAPCWCGSGKKFKKCCGS